MRYVAESMRLSVEGKYLTTSFDELLRPRGGINVEAVIEHVASRLERS